MNPIDMNNANSFQKLDSHPDTSLANPLSAPPSQAGEGEWKTVAPRSKSRSLPKRRHDDVELSPNKAATLEPPTRRPSAGSSIAPSLYDHASSQADSARKQGNTGDVFGDDSTHRATSFLDKLRYAGTDLGTPSPVRTTKGALTLHGANNTDDNEDNMDTEPDTWNPEEIKKAVPKTQLMRPEGGFAQRFFPIEHVLRNATPEQKKLLLEHGGDPDDDENTSTDILSYFFGDTDTNSNAMREAALLEVLTELNINVDEVTIISIGGDTTARNTKKKYTPSSSATSADPHIAFQLIKGLTKEEWTLLRKISSHSSDAGSVFFETIPLPFTDFAGVLKGITPAATSGTKKRMCELVREAVLASDTVLQFLLANHIPRDTSPPLDTLDDIDMDDAHKPAMATGAKEWTVEEVDRASSYRRRLAETIRVEAAVPKTKGLNPVWSVFVRAPYTKKINLHLAWHKTIMNLKFDNLPYGVYNRSLPNRWCTGCQSYDHILDCCPYPNLPGWKRQVNLAPADTNKNKDTQRGSNTGRFAGGRGRGRGARA